MNRKESFLTRDEEEYYLQRMQEVSRSFAIVVPQLEKPLDDYTGISYLLCRVADNIEDVEASERFKADRFEEMTNLLNGSAEAATVLREWDSYQWPGLTVHEQKMMTTENGLKLWQIYNRLPNQPRRHISYWVSEMISGMVDSLHPEKTIFKTQDNLTLLESVEAYNRYCFVVAGNVGHLLTRLTADFYDFSQHTLHKLLHYTEDFARTLQKTNIIKDFGKDLARGVCYIPQKWLKSASELIHGISMDTKRRVLEDIYSELKGAVQYISHIPYHARGYRIGALLCVLPAFETIRIATQNIQKTLSPDAGIKISRETLGACYQLALRIADDNSVLHQYHEEQLEMLKNAFQEHYSM